MNASLLRQDRLLPHAILLRSCVVNTAETEVHPVCRSQHPGKVQTKNVHDLMLWMSQSELTRHIYGAAGSTSADHGCN